MKIGVLILACALGLLSRSQAQELPPPPNLLVPQGLPVYSVSEGPFPYSSGTEWVHWIWNGTSGKESQDIPVVAISRLLIPAENIVADNQGWMVKMAPEADGTTSIWWVAKPGQSIPPQSWQGFKVLVLGEFGPLGGDGGLCAIPNGKSLGNCTKLTAWKRQ